MSGVSVSRALWTRIETLHAVTYFGEETKTAAAELGCSGFWSGYFGLRAAPMGPVSAGVVDATFFNFAPSFVRRWVPAVWAAATPEAFVDARSRAAAATLRLAAPDIGVAATANGALARVVAACVAAGRPLFAANRDLAPPDDPVAALWQLCTSLREHRGDGHLAALTANGVDGLEAHVLIALDGGSDPGDLQRTRGWTADDWDAAVDGLRGRGLVAADGTLSADGRRVRERVEATTDELALAPWSVLSDDERDDVLAVLTPAAVAVAGAGVIRYPNPIGLPSVADEALEP